MPTAYGFLNLEDVFGVRVQEAGVDEVFTAIEESIRIHNEQFNFLYGTLILPTTDWQIKYRSLGFGMLQPMDQTSRALPVKAGAQYSVGFPFQRAGDAWGNDWEAGIKMTVRQANDFTQRMIQDDQNWLRFHILGSIFNETNYTFDDPEHGDLPVKALANGDTQEYYVLGGSTDPVTADHFIAQAAGIADATNPFPAGYDQLKSFPDNSGEVFALVATANVTAIKGLATFHPVADPNLQRGIANDVLVGDPGIVTPGKLIGYVEPGVWIFQWAQIPTNYIVMQATGSPPPVAMRQDPVPELQGLVLASRQVDFPWEELQYRRHAGFGILNRTAAYVIRVGNAVYAPPTNYTLPMP